MPQTEWFNSGYLSSGSSGGWLAEIKVSSGVGSFWGREGRVCPGPSPPCVSSHRLPSVCVSVQISPFHEDTSHVGLGVTLMNAPYLVTPGKIPPPITLHGEGLGPHPMNMGG